jgi:hypothetical protein
MQELPKRVVIAINDIERLNSIQRADDERCDNGLIGVTTDAIHHVSNQRHVVTANIVWLYPLG